MPANIHFRDDGVRRGLLAAEWLRSQHGPWLPGRDGSAQRLSGTLMPDWRHEHWLRAPGRTWYRIVPAILSPTANNGQGIQGGTGTTRTLASYSVGSGATMLIAGVHVWHSSSTRTINSVTFDGAAMTAGQTVVFTGDGRHRSTLYYLPSPAITTGDIVATFNASGSGQSSGVCAFWVDGVAATGPEAGQTGSGFQSGSGVNMTATIATVSDGALVAAFSGFWSGPTVSQGGENTELVHTGTTDHFCAIGYGVVGAAGSHTLGWQGGGDPSWSLVLNSFAATEGGGGSVSLPWPARRRSSLICR